MAIYCFVTGAKVENALIHVYPAVVRGSFVGGEVVSRCSRLPICAYSSRTLQIPHPEIYIYSRRAQ